MLSFKELNKQFQNNNFESIENDPRGIRFLKLRSVSRKETITELVSFSGVETNLTSARLIFEEVFNNPNVTNDQINEYINDKYIQERQERKDQEEFLIDQLSRLQVFDWGGSKGNSLEKNIVDNYVKKIRSYDLINEEIEGRLLNSLRGYTLNSWYNHWTSILIEDIFKDHPSILPTVGLIKKVDFFISDVPFDLKVTYFPEQLMKEKLRAVGYGNELTRTKQVCRSLRIHIPTDLKDDALKSHLQNVLKEHQSDEARAFLLDLHQNKMDIISASRENPEELKVWLYENQGEMRFDASNRFFLILVNDASPSESWKIKRNISFLRENINKHLDSVSQDVESLQTSFYWKKDEKTYNCKSDILFISYT